MNSTLKNMRRSTGRLLIVSAVVLPCAVIYTRLHAGATPAAVQLIRNSAIGIQSYAEICELKAGQTVIATATDSGQGAVIEAAIPAAENVIVDDSDLGNSTIARVEVPNVQSVTGTYEDPNCTDARATVTYRFRLNNKDQAVVISASPVTGRRHINPTQVAAL